MPILPMMATSSVIWFPNTAWNTMMGQLSPPPSCVALPFSRAILAGGASAFAALPALKPSVYPTATEANRLGRVADTLYGRGETRHGSPRDGMAEKLWIYALPNPHPEKPIRSITCMPKKERSLSFMGLPSPTLKRIPCGPARARSYI